MKRTHCALAAIFIVSLALVHAAAAQQITAGSQEQQGQLAMERGDYVQAIVLLSEALAVRPAINTYVQLGVSYRHIREWQKAEDLLEEGSRQFPQDPRIPTELANAYLGAGDVESARQALRRALQIDPANVTAADLLAAIELSEGEVQTALSVWNRSGSPIVGRVLHNSNTHFGHWTVPKALAFKQGTLMTYAQWRTTELRLLETGKFSNVGIDVEPAPVSNLFNPIILTTPKVNDLSNIAFGIIKGVPLRTPYFDWWDIAHSGVNLNSSYRWDYNRRRGEVQLQAPLPVPGILFLTGRGLWRSERWDVSRILLDSADAAGDANRFQLNLTGVRAELKYIPSYKFDFGGGVEYTNRYGSGGPPELLVNSQNSAKILLQGNLRLADGRYRNRLHADGYVARKGIVGDLSYSAIAVDMNNEFLIKKDSQTVLNWTLQGGTSSGELPVEDYFTLAVDTHSRNLLRAHQASRQGHYGNSPMGTSFALSNLEIVRRIAILPLFNTLNLPYLDVKVMAFLDGGTTWDRSGIFKEGTLNIDAGGGLRFETRTHALNLIYGRAIQDNWNVFALYIEKHW